MEQSFLAWLRGRVRQMTAADAPGLRPAVGIGDDGAVLDIPQGQQLIAATDTIIDQVDFVSGEHSWQDIGYKSLAINLSDIAAMGGDPKWALVTLNLPSAAATQVAAGVYEGIIECAEQYATAIVGGDLSVHEGRLSITVTLLGTVPHGAAWLRSGAREGDVLVVSGPLGGSLMGRHLRPRPRLDVVERLRGRIDVHAAIDISDGFSLDLDRLCAASGVGAQIDTALLPIHGDAEKRAETTGRKPLEHALSDGEDFELILALAPEDWAAISEEAAALGLVRVGEFAGRTGLWSRTDRGLKRMLPGGFIHGARE